MTAFMRLMEGTLQFEVNGHISGDYKLEKGTGQGDPKSCYCYNTAVAPLNEYLSNSPEVPKYKVGRTEIGSVYFADDNGLILSGENIQEIISVLQKIAAYREVSGLRLNLAKCEFIAINCDEGARQSLIDMGMKRVTSFKHLGVHIDQIGEAKEEDNIRPILNNMVGIAKRYSNVGSTPIGRALYGTFLMASRYVHRLQNTVISGKMMEELKDATIQMLWTRVRYQEEQVGWRVHIARARVSHPYQYGGLRLPDPEVRNTAIRMTWLRKFNSNYSGQGWYIILNEWMHQLNRPNIEEHMGLGVKEWRRTAEKLDEVSKYWAEVFRAGETLQRLQIEQHPEWCSIPIVGSTDQGDEVMLTSVEYANPIARPIVRSGLRVVGQLFKTDEAGMIDSSRMKTLEEVRDEFACPNALLWNTFVSIVNQVKVKYASQIRSKKWRQTTKTCLETMVERYKKGCSAASRLLLKKERLEWKWGNVPPSYKTYVRDGMVNVKESEFMDAFKIVRNTVLTPSMQWTSTQILLRTLWTRVKESHSRRGNLDIRCLNCGLEPEHTRHIFFGCKLVRDVKDKLELAIKGERTMDTKLTENMVMFHVYESDASESGRRDIDDLLIIFKHVLWRLRFRENTNRFPKAKLVIVTLIIELEYLLKCRQIMGAETFGVLDMIKTLRREINWTE